MNADDKTPAGTAMSATNATQNDPGIPRSALERVLARATELQTGSSEPIETVSESRLLEIAREVGIPADNLRQALAEERAKVPYAENESGLLLDAMGITSVSAQRTVSGTPQTILAALEPWMQRMEFMAVQRRTSNRIVWEPVYSIANYVRATGPTGRRRDLARVDQVSVSVTPVDESRSVVRFDVQLNGLRRTNRNLAVGLGIGVSMPVVVAPALLLLILNLSTAFSTAMFAAMAIIPAAISFGIWRLVRNAYRRTVQRSEVRIEQLLDELEQGTLVTAPSLLGQLRDVMLSAAAAVRPVPPQPPPSGDR